MQEPETNPQTPANPLGAPLSHSDASSVQPVIRGAELSTTMADLLVGDVTEPVAGVVACYCRLQQRPSPQDS